MELVCYSNHAEKRDLFSRVVVPGILVRARAGSRSRILTNWLRANQVTQAPRGMAQLNMLHQAARAGRYVPAPGGCDSLLDVSTVIQSGGDCDNWAAVLLAALLRLNYGPVRLSSFGDATDPHRHVAVSVWWAGGWRYLDAKGDQRGAEFLARPRGFEQETVHGAEA